MVDWIQLLQTFGLAVAILFAVGIAAWKTARWVAAEVVIPFRDQAIRRFDEFLAKIDGTLTKVDGSVNSMIFSLNTQTSVLQRIQSSNADISQSADRTATALEAEYSKLREDASARQADLKVDLVAIKAELGEVHRLLVCVMDRLGRIDEKEPSK